MNRTRAEDGRPANARLPLKYKLFYIIPRSIPKTLNNHCYPQVGEGRNFLSKEGLKKEVLAYYATLASQIDMEFRSGLDPLRIFNPSALGRKNILQTYMK